MNKDELIKQIEINSDGKKKLTEQLEEIKKEEEKLMDILKNGLTFPSMAITKVIGYLLTIYECELYLPVAGKYYIMGKAYDYIILVPINSFASNEKKFSAFKYQYDDQIVMVDETADFLQDIKENKGHTLTFNHLLDEYGAKKISKRICVDNFDNYPYIKEFISKVASMQIENNGKRLTEDELLIAMADFINFKKIKPKTKELNKNN